MKKIEAIIRPEKLTDTIKELKRIGVGGLPFPKSLDVGNRRIQKVRIAVITIKLHCIQKLKLKSSYQIIWLSRRLKRLLRLVKQARTAMVRYMYILSLKHIAFAQVNPMMISMI